MEQKPDQAWLRKQVLAVQRRDTVPGLTVAVGHAGDSVLLENAGCADVDSGVPVTDSTQFRVGSITKTFTAAVILGLAERGVLDLDEPVQAYLPDVDLGRVRVRIRHLLAHCSGVQREVPGTMWATLRGPDKAGLLAALGQAVPVDGPGVRWHYSNLGYAILGQVVEQVTGRDCRAVIDSDLLAPLGLASTTWQPGRGAATGYRSDPYTDRVHVEPDMDQGAVGVGGQLWSTASDLLAWGDALAGGRPEILSSAVVDAMHHPQIMVDTTSWSAAWGLGLMLTRRDDRIVAGHTGAMPGFAAALSVHRATRTVVAGLASLTRGADVAGLCATVLDQAVTSLAEERESAVSDPWRPGPSCPAEVEGVLGRWWSEAEETVFTWRAGHLHAHLASRPEATDTRFQQLSTDHYRAVEGRLPGEHLLVEREADGMVRHLVWATYPHTRTPR
ncbi:MAG: beta-lactamase family protein [Micromonosporaceae bacterium]|nr:beta-lactamase family protein [Micromonosporaceae bacterium]